MKGKVMSNADYRKSEGISSSELKQLMKTPAHYRYWKDNPEETDSQALLFGRACHKYVLETYDFYNEFEVAKDFKYGTKEDKAETQQFICQKATELGKGAEWDSFIITNPKKEQVVDFYRGLIAGKDIITEEMFEQIDAMRNALLATPFVNKLIYGEHETSFFWTDELTGLKCKVRPDSINHNLKIIVDYKTTDCAETEHFMRQAIRLGYDLQASYYLDGVKANLECSECNNKGIGYYDYKNKLYCKSCLEKKIKNEYIEKMKNDYSEEYFYQYLNEKTQNIPYFEDYIFVFIAQEKKPPYAVNILQADEIFIRSGRELYKSMLQTYKDCSESGVWYGYMGNENQINLLGVPKWIENMLGEESECDE